MTGCQYAGGVTAPLVTRRAISKRNINLGEDSRSLRLSRDLGVA